MTPDIPILPDTYKAQDDELATEDTQLVAFARWRHFLEPVGLMRLNGRLRWIVKDDHRWFLAKHEFTMVREYYERHSQTVGRLKSMCRQAMQDKTDG